MKKIVAILGSTGSIGQSTLDIVRKSDRSRFDVVALTANKNAKLLAEQAIEFNVKYVALADNRNANTLKEMLNGFDVEIGYGGEGAKYQSQYHVSDTYGHEFVGGAS